MERLEDVRRKLNTKLGPLTALVHDLLHSTPSSELNLSACDEDITQVFVEAKKMLQDVKCETEIKLTKEAVDKAVATLSMQHEKDKSETIRQLETFRHTARENEDAVRRASEVRIGDIVRQTNELKIQVQSTLKRTEEEKQQCLKQKEVQLNDLRIEMEKEMEHVRLQCEKRIQDELSKFEAQKLEYENMIHSASNSSVEEKERNSKLLSLLKDQHEGVMKEMKCKESELQGKISELNAANNSLKQTLSATEDELKSSLSKLEHLQATQNQTQSQLDNTLKKVTTLEEELQQCKRLVETKNDCIRKGEDEIEKQNVAISKLKEDIVKLNNDLRISTESNDKLKSLLTSSQKDYAALQAQNLKLKTDLEESNRHGQGLHSKLDSLQKNYSSEKCKREELEKEVSTWKQKCSDIEATLQATKAERNQTVDNLRQEMARQLTNASSESSSAFSTMLQSHKDELKRQETHYQNLLTSAAADYRDKLDAVQAKHEAAAKVLKDKISEYENERRKLLSEIQKWKDEQIATDGEKKKALASASEKNTAISQLEQQYADALHKITEKGQQIAECEKNIEQLKATIQKKDEDIAKEKLAVQSANVKCADAQTALQKLQRQYDVDKKDWQAKLEAHGEAITQSKIEMALKRAKEQHQRELEEEIKRVEAKWEDVVKEKTASWKRQLDQAESDSKSKLEKQRQEMQKKIDQLENDIKTQRNSFHSADTESQRALAKAEERFLQEKESLMSSLRDATKQHQQQMDTLNALWKRVCEKTSSWVSGALPILEGDRLQFTDVIYRSLKELNAVTMQNLLDQFESTRKEDAMRASEYLHKSLEEIRVAMAADSKKQMESLNSDSAKEIQRLNAALDSERKTVLELKSNVEEYLKHFHAKDAHIKQLTKQLQDEHNCLEVARQNTVRVRDEGKRLMDEAIRANNDKWRNQIEEKERYWKGEVAREKSDAHRREEELKDTISQLDYKYLNRESRHEDVQRINELMKCLRDKDEALIKMHKEMSLYKLELTNKEETYNKVFGRQPVVSNVVATGFASAPVGPPPPAVPVSSRKHANPPQPGGTVPTPAGGTGHVRGSHTPTPFVRQDSSMSSMALRARAGSEIGMKRPSGV